MTYTQYKLTEAQCKVLASFMAAKPENHKHGVASDALVRKGLVEKSEFFYPCCAITANGIEALEQARREGW